MKEVWYGCSSTLALGSMLTTPSARRRYRGQRQLDIRLRVDLLLAAGARVDVANRPGQTPLLYAADWQASVSDAGDRMVHAMKAVRAAAVCDIDGGSGRCFRSPSGESSVVWSSSCLRWEQGLPSMWMSWARWLCSGVAEEWHAIVVRLLLRPGLRWTQRTRSIGH